MKMNEQIPWIMKSVLNEEKEVIGQKQYLGDVKMWRVLKKWKEIAREVRGKLVKDNVLEIKGREIYFVKSFSQTY